MVKGMLQTAEPAQDTRSRQLDGKILEDHIQFHGMNPDHEMESPKDWGKNDRAGPSLLEVISYRL